MLAGERERSSGEPSGRRTRGAARSTRCASEPAPPPGRRAPARQRGDRRLGRTQLLPHRPPVLVPASPRCPRRLLRRRRRCRRRPSSRSRRAPLWTRGPPGGARLPRLVGLAPLAPLAFARGSCSKSTGTRMKVRAEAPTGRRGREREGWRRTCSSRRISRAASAPRVDLGVWDVGRRRQRQRRRRRRRRRWRWFHGRCAPARACAALPPARSSTRKNLDEAAPVPAKGAPLKAPPSYASYRGRRAGPIAACQAGSRIVPHLAMGGNRGTGDVHVHNVGFHGCKCRSAIALCHQSTHRGI